MLQDNCLLEVLNSQRLIAERAEMEDDMVHLRKSNSFRRTIKDMEKEADEIDDHIETLKKRLKSWSFTAILVLTFQAEMIY